jgi:hypothetical protein
LKKVLKRPEILPKIEDAVLRMNEIATRSYQFINFYIWHLFINNKTIPVIDKPFLTKVFDLVAEKRKNKTRPVKVKPNSLKRNTGPTGSTGQTGPTEIFIRKIFLIKCPLNRF